MYLFFLFFFFFSSRRRHTRWTGVWSSDVCSSDLRSLLHVAGQGSLAIELAPRDAGTADVDLYVYRTDPFGFPGPLAGVSAAAGAQERVQRSEERRVGKEWRCRGAAEQ